MHAALTRASGQHQGRRPNAAVLPVLAAALILALAGPLTAAQAPTTAAADITGSLRPAGTDHELRIEVTRPGSEALTLGARLKTGGGLITRPIAWTIRQSLGSGGGDIVWHSDDPVAATPLAPGDYVIEAAYGAARFSQPVSITPGQRMAMTFILNVGGIRPLSRIDGVGYPSSLPATHTIYALTGPEAGKAVAGDIEQGEIIRVAAGSYRIESRFADGNTVAETKVTVRPGILTSIEISHLASFAQVTIPAAAGQPVTWRIRQTGGDWQRTGKGDTFALVLAPGTYAVKADIGGHSLTSEFTLKANDVKHLMLGQ